MKFDKYSIAPAIKKRIEELGFKKPTDIQYKTIPNILKGEDVLAIAQTGTGKTAAYVIPVIHKIDLQKMNSRVKGIKCLVMVPTRELAIQIKNVFNDLGKYLKVNAVAVYGGVEQDPQIKSLNDKADILVATPGRMFDLINQGYINISRIRTLVVDEADLMLQKGFYKDIKDVQRHIPKNRQTLFFSATIDHNIKKLAYSLVVNAIRIQLSPKDPISKNVTHYKMRVLQDDKRFFLEELIKENKESKILVFVRTKVRSERVSKAMDRVGIKNLVLNGDVAQYDRLKVLKQFKSSQDHILIATDVSARGIDIPDVKIVVNYDIPTEAETYVHRIGRTGRGRNSGLAYTFYTPDDRDMLYQIEEYITKEITEINISKGLYKDVVGFTEDQPLTMDSLQNMVSEIEKSKKKKRKKR